MSEEYKNDVESMLKLCKKLRRKLGEEGVNYKDESAIRWALYEIKIQTEKILAKAG